MKGRVHTPGSKAGQHRLGIGMSKPGFIFTRTLEFFTQFEVVVYLAIECEDVPPASGVHRLVAGRRDVNDRKAAMTERDAGLPVYPDISIIRAAVFERVGHCSQSLGLGQA